MAKDGLKQRRLSDAFGFRPLLKVGNKSERSGRPFFSCSASSCCEPIATLARNLTGVSRSVSTVHFHSALHEELEPAAGVVHLCKRNPSPLREPAQLATCFPPASHGPHKAFRQGRIPWKAWVLRRNLQEQLTATDQGLRLQRACRKRRISAQRKSGRRTPDATSLKRKIECRDNQR